MKTKKRKSVRRRNTIIRAIAKAGPDALSRWKALHNYQRDEPNAASQLVYRWKQMNAMRANPIFSSDAVACEDGMEDASGNFIAEETTRFRDYYHEQLTDTRRRTIEMIESAFRNWDADFFAAISRAMRQRPSLDAGEHRLFLMEVVFRNKSVERFAKEQAKGEDDYRARLKRYSRWLAQINPAKDK